MRHSSHILSLRQRAVAAFGSVFLVFSLSARADHRELPKEGASPTLKLGELISEALSQNAALKASRAQHEEKEASIGPAGSWQDPMLGFEAMNYPVDNFRPSPTGMTGNQMSLSQKIPFPGKLGQKSDAARFEAIAEKAALRDKELETIKKVKLVYYELFLSYRKLDTLKDRKSLLEQLTTVTRNNYALGKIPQAEVLNLQVETASLLDEILSIERMIKTQLGELNHLLGRWDHSQYLYGRPEELKTELVDLSSQSEKRLLDLAFDRNPGIEKRKAEVQAAEKRVSFARRNYLPDFDIKLGYTFRQATAMDSGTDFVSGMVGITLPLWAGSKQSEEKRGADAQKMKAEALLDEARNMLAHEIHTIHAELEEAAKRVKLYQGGVIPLTRQAVISARSAYLTGKLEYATLLNTINRRFQMEVSSAEALATYHSKVAELEAILGEPLGGAK